MKNGGIPTFSTKGRRHPAPQPPRPDPEPTPCHLCLHTLRTGAGSARPQRRQRHEHRWLPGLGRTDGTARSPGHQPDVAGGAPRESSHRGVPHLVADLGHAHAGVDQEPLGLMETSGGQVADR